MFRFAVLITILTAAVTLFVDFAFAQGDAPPFIKGQQATAKSVASVIQVPAKQATKISSSQTHLDLNNTNLLENSGFEHVTVNTGWTGAVTGTAVISYTQDSSCMQGSGKCIRITCNGGASGGTCSFKQSPTTTAGLNTLIGAYYKSEAKGVSSGPTTVLYTLVGGTRTSSLDVSNSGTTENWAPWFVNEVSGTSAGLEALITVGASNEIDLSLDWAKVSPGEIPNASIITPWTAGACTSSHTTNTITTCKYRQIGDSIQIAFKNTYTGVPNAANLTFTLPNSWVMDTSKMLSATTQTKLGEAFISDTGVNTYPQVAYYSTSSSILIVQSTTASGTNPVNLTNGNAVTATSPVNLNSTDFVETNIFVPIANLAGSTQVFASQCGAGCENHFTALITDGAVTTTVSGENVDWINGNCTNASTGNYVCTFNSNLFTVPPVCVATTTATGAIIGGLATSTNYSLGSISRADTLGLLDTSFYLTCDKQGADYISSRTIVGSFKDMVTTPNSGKPVIYSGAVDATGVVSGELGDLINGNCSISGTSIYTCTLNANKVSAKPVCQIAIDNAAVNNLVGFYDYTNATTSSIKFITQSSATGSAAARAFTFLCHGVLP
jgi:hypothetical protein